MPNNNIIRIVYKKEFSIIIKAEDFNFALTNLLINFYSPDYEKSFEELTFDPAQIDYLTQEELDKLTKLAAIIEYVGNRQFDLKSMLS